MLSSIQAAKLSQSTYNTEPGAVVTQLTTYFKCCYDGNLGSWSLQQCEALLIKLVSQLGAAVHACNPSTHEAEAVAL